MSRIKEQAKNKKNARSIELEILPNPSHLEMVAVVAGVTRGKQFKISHTNGHGDNARNKVIPLVIHGDASFLG